MKYAALTIALLLAGCGTLPEPFYGNSGPLSAKLSIPPAPVLIVPTPDNALLASDSAKLYATDLASALAAADVPSTARPANKTDWRITTTASLTGTTVTPHYEITGPDNKNYGNENGAAVPAADWANGNPTALANAAQTDSLTLAKLLGTINAKIQQSNPNSLENRPARLYLTGVSGAPGDGDTSLALNLNRDLPPLGLTLAPSAAQADFTITGIVKTTPDTNNQILIEIDWIIKDSNNRNIGQVTQLHDLNPTDITPYWGDVAAAAATQGATGIQEAVRNATLHKAGVGS
jgi:hypothetical protein